ncbi:MAG: hypothetical protein WKG07_31945 [Hymenobacter sp.]
MLQPGDGHQHHSILRLHHFYHRAQRAKRVLDRLQAAALIEGNQLPEYRRGPVRPVDRVGRKPLLLASGGMALAL